MSRPLIRVATYNLLSSELASPSFFLKCAAEALDRKKRWSRLETVLREELQRGSILCLQEVSEEWQGRLAVLLSEHGYYTLGRQYGGRHSGYMGVAIAVPPAFAVEAAKTRRLADKLPRPPRSAAPPTTIVTRVSGLLQSLVPPLLGSALASVAARVPGLGGWLAQRGARSALPEAWKLALDNWNCVAFVVLRHKESGERFGLANYHMPCKFWCPAMMVVHAHALASATHGWAQAEGVPYMIAGDFNFVPGSAPYTLFTRGELDTAHVDCPPPLAPGVPFEPRIPAVLRSAYLEATGAEPELTNKAVTKFDPERTFMGALDYVFMSPGIRAVRADPLPSAEDVASIPSFPTVEYPSDHLKVAVEVELGGEK